MRNLVLVALMGVTLAGRVLAADVTADSVLGTTMQEVQDALAAMGYEIRKSEMEDGLIEVYFVRDGQMGEVYVDPATGAVVKLSVKG